MKVGVPPPVPRRAAATSLSAGRQDSLVLSRHSLSSSTSSLSSNFSERTTGSYDVSRASGEAQLPMFSAPASGTVMFTMHVQCLILLLPFLSLIHPLLTPSLSLIPYPSSPAGTQSELQQSPPRIPPKHSRKSAQGERRY